MSGGTVRRIAVATCAVCTTNDGKTAYEKRCGVKFDGLLMPYGAKTSYKPISSKDEARLHQLGNNMFLGIFTGYVLRAGVDGQVNMSASDIRVRRFKHQEVAQEGELSFPCADGSLKQFDLPQHPRGECPPGETLRKMKKKKRKPFSNKKTVRTF